MKVILDNLPLVFSIFSKNSPKIVKEECEEWPRFSVNMCTVGYSDFDFFEKMKSLDPERSGK
jgi:hypothetical protein